MRNSEKILWVAIAMAVTLFTAGLLSPAVAAEKMYKMSGEITAINTVHDTVVVEVPMGKKMFTVAGPLASDAKLMKNGRKANLSDFRAGEKATVTFHSNMDGHVIDSLTSR